MAGYELPPELAVLRQQALARREENKTKGDPDGGDAIFLIPDHWYDLPRLAVRLGIRRDQLYGSLLKLTRRRGSGKYNPPHQIKADAKLVRWCEMKFLRVRLVQPDEEITT